MFAPLSSSSSSSAPAASDAASGGASAGNHKRPRHFHAGPRPTAEDEEEKQQEEIARQPPAARLYRHALESIFGFLSLKELRSVLAVSRLWSSAVGSMRGIDADWPTTHSLFEACASRLARHVGTLGSADGAVELDRQTSLRLSNLHTLHYRSPHPLVQPLHFPPSLTLLGIDISNATSNSDANSLIEQASRVFNLRSLALGLEFDNEPLSFAPLVRLPHLREVDLSNYSVWLTSEQIDELRALPHLRVLKLFLTGDELRSLLRPPHQLQLHTLDIAELDPESAALLASLPSLTDLSVDDEESLAFLTFTPNLRILTLSSLLRIKSCSPEEMIAGIETNCKQITSLGISNSRLTAAHMRALLSLMPMLSQLELGSMFEMESLSFLSSLKPLQRSLTSLLIKLCCHPQLRSVEVRHIFALQQLTHLRIRYSFTEKLDSFTLHELQVPSQRLPNLIDSEIRGNY